MHDFPLNTLVNANRNVEAAAPKIEPPRCKHGVVEHWHCPQCANEMTKPHGPVSENFMVHHYGPSGYVKPEAVVPDPATQTKTVFCCRHGQFPNPCQICTGYVVNSAVLSDPKPSHQRELPRRCYMDLYSPGELAISKAVDAVEMMGADVRLTEAVVLLSKAKDKVADFVDGVEGEAKPVASPPEK